MPEARSVDHPSAPPCRFLTAESVPGTPDRTQRQTGRLSSWHCKCRWSHLWSHLATWLSCCCPISMQSWAISQYSACILEGTWRYPASAQPPATSSNLQWGSVLTRPQLLWPAVVCPYYTGVARSSGLGPSTACTRPGSSCSNPSPLRGRKEAQKFKVICGD